MKIVWAKPARDDMVALREFIRIENPSAAARVAERIMAIVELISKNPGIGRAGRVSQTREMFVTQTPFLIAYSVFEQRLVILRVLHGVRKWA
ncbi:MAG: type II toxin-antitoxin system RelE/ParE family toxin [Myxococcaceae bacterium]